MPKLKTAFIKMRRNAFFANFKQLVKFANFYELQNGRPRILGLC